LVRDFIISDDDTDVRLGVVACGRPTEQRRQTEADRRRPDHRHPTTGPRAGHDTHTHTHTDTPRTTTGPRRSQPEGRRAGHDAGVAVWLAQCDVLVDAQPRQRVNGRDVEDGGQVGLHVTEPLAVDPPLEHRTDYSYITHWC